MAGDDDMAASDPLWDDICETLLSLAKAPPRQRRRATAGRSAAQLATDDRRREEARRRPPGAGTAAARALAAFVPGAWLSAQDVARRMGERLRVGPPLIYVVFWRKGWVERIDDPERGERPIPGKGPRGPRRLWRLTALGEAVRAALLEGATLAGGVEERPLVGLAENPWQPKPAKRKPRRSGAMSAGGRGRRRSRSSPGTGRAG